MAAKIGIACDHAGKELKQLLQEYLAVTEYEVVDYGVSSQTQSSVDYPDYAALVAADLSNKKIDRGVLICGTGIGMCITANKVPGVRAASVWDEFTARMSRAHNDANIICLGARTLNYHRACDLLKIWLETPYENGRHQLRLNKIKNLENTYSGVKDERN